MEEFAIKVNKDNVQKVLQKMEDKGYRWISGNLPTAHEKQLISKAENVYILVKNKVADFIFTRYPSVPTVLLAEEFLNFVFSDLKTGHIVTLRDGTKMVVYKDVAGAPGRDFVVDDEWGELTGQYHEDLMHKTYDQLDIMKVEEPTYISDLGMTNTKHKKVVYERIKPKEMTLAEIEKELGYKIKLVEES